MTYEFKALLRRFAFCFMLLSLLVAVAGCGGSSGSDTPATPEALFRDNFVADIVATWDGVDYSSESPDGYSDSDGDGDGDVDADDAVMIIETLRSMGYAVPRTTLQGMYGHQYSLTAEYDTALLAAASDIQTFSYTVASTVTQTDLQNADWSGLEKGDLIFLDYNKDTVWDNAAIYLGPYAGYSNAAFLVSDYYDEGLVVDLDWDSEMINLGIAYGFSMVRKLNMDALDSVYSE